MKKAATAPESTTAVRDLPAIGAEFFGGFYAGVTTLPSGQLRAVVLLEAAPPKALTWARAKTWAKRAGGELPTRPVGALLFANLPDRFEKVRHWTCETCSWDSSYAWYQYFGVGSQDYYHKSYEGRARAVRTIQIVA